MLYNKYDAGHLSQCQRQGNAARTEKSLVQCQSYQNTCVMLAENFNPHWIDHCRYQALIEHALELSTAAS